MNETHCSSHNQIQKIGIIKQKKTIPILIPTSSPKMATEIDYSLNNHFFDPTKSSPPNCFLLKLEKRLQSHYSLGIQDSKLVNV